MRTATDTADAGDPTGETGRVAAGTSDCADTDAAVAPSDVAACLLDTEVHPTASAAPTHARTERSGRRTIPLGFTT